MLSKSTLINLPVYYMFLLIVLVGVTNNRKLFKVDYFRVMWRVEDDIIWWLGITIPSWVGITVLGEDE